MNLSFWEYAVLGACAFSIGFSLAAAIFCSDGQESRAGLTAERAKAMTAGVAQYELDPKTGQVVFKYVNLEEYTQYIVRQMRPQITRGNQ